eukprot:TRINITY_DN1489_c0_g1_i1.p1 TRINITY_DN1489_c0_g1~~TRINITY_DN1489_c0_g1_i1.p1  ORF type:complete len:349 (-),score=79.54 TRINITY_DN1489_c0_g1_i1:36-1025(-)
MAFRLLVRSQAPRLLGLGNRSFSKAPAQSPKEKKGGGKTNKDAVQDEIAQMFNTQLVAGSNKEKAVATFDLSNPSLSTVNPKNIYEYRTPGLVYHEMRSNRRKRPVVYLPFPNIKAGDLHAFFDHSSGHCSCVLLANYSNVEKNDRLVLFNNQDPEKVANAFQNTFFVSYVLGFHPMQPRVSSQWHGVQSLLQEVSKTLQSSREEMRQKIDPDTKPFEQAAQQRKTSALGQRSVHVHASDLAISHLMNLPNEFDSSSKHPAVAVRQLVKSLANQQIQVKFHHVKAGLPYEERTNYHEYIELADRLARRAMQQARLQEISQTSQTSTMKS